MNPLRAIAKAWTGLQRLAAADLSATSDFWYSDVSAPVAANVTVTESTALNYSAVWAATRLFSGTIGALPTNLYKRGDNRGKSVLYSDTRNALVQYQPNSEMLAMMFFAQGVAQQVNAGNCFAEIERRRRDNFPLAMWPIHHTRVRLVRDTKTNNLKYEVKNNTAEPSYIDPADMLHVPSMISDNGLWGQGVIQHARESIGMGLATEKYGSKWFGSGGIPRVVIETPKTMNPESRENFRKEWREIYGGPEGDRVALLTQGATAKTLNVTPEDSQFLGSREHNINEIARWYGIPPHMLGDLRRATYSNIEEQSIEFVQYTLLPWLILWEQELDRKLLTPAEQETMFFKFNVNGLLRGNATQRAAIYHAAITDGWASHNEVRELEDWNPVPGGDVRYIQGAMMPIGEDGLPVVPGANTSATDAIDVQFEPVTDAKGAATTGDVQATALNGAQIVALKAIADGLAMEQLPPEGTRAMLQAAFPLMDRDLIEQMVSSLNGFTPKTPEPPEPVAQPADTPPADTPPAAPDAVTDAARVMLTGAVARMLRKESHDARFAAKTPGTFIKWLDSFYTATYAERFTEAIQPPCEALSMLGYAADAGTIAASQVQQSRDELYALTTCTVSELPQRVEATMTEWQSRPTQVAEAVLTKGKS